LASLASPGCLARALKQMSRSAEVYFYFRQRLASSHGAQSIANWILGIGDRHLSNSLVSTKTGSYVILKLFFIFYFFVIVLIF
jgi:phosphatidylinositol kinase/protein kinase (PI-3  family)